MRFDTENDIRIGSTTRVLACAHLPPGFSAQRLYSRMKSYGDRASKPWLRPPYLLSTLSKDVRLSWLWLSLTYVFPHLLTTCLKEVMLSWPWRWHDFRKGSPTGVLATHCFGVNDVFALEMRIYTENDCRNGSPTQVLAKHIIYRISVNSVRILLLALG